MEGLAFDRAAVSVRSKDSEGRLHVEVTPITKSNVCGYKGTEIPKWDILGLSPNRIYQLYRDPSELEKSIPTWNNVPVLSRHILFTVAAPPKDAIIGSTGTDADWQSPFVENSLVIWDADAIRRIESDEQKEISASYRYDPDMTPGTVGGCHFDGVMRNIRANHVAIVPKGRAGPDVVVGDSASHTQEIRRMPRPILTKRSALARSTLTAALRPFAAMDAELQDVIKLLDGLENAPDAAAGAAPAEGSPAPGAAPGGEAGASGPEDDADDAAGVDPDVETQIKAILNGKVSPEEIAKILAVVKPAAEPATDAPAQAGASAGAGNTDSKETPPAVGADPKSDNTPITRPAMDAAIASAVRATEARTIARLNGARSAEKAVRPYVGTLDVAMDSADAVYAAALRYLGVDTKGVHPSAFPAILKAQPLPGSRHAPRAVAMDAAPSAGFTSRFPNAGKIGTV